MWPFQVNGDQLVEALLGGFEKIQAGGRRYARIVHEQIQPAEAGADRVDQRSAIGRFGDIALNDFNAGFSAEGLSGIAASFVSSDDVVGGCELGRYAAADSATRTGYYGDRFQERTPSSGS